MQIANVRARKGWFKAAEQSSDPVYVLAVLSLGERWAELMEPRLADGGKIADIADKTRPAGPPQTDALMPDTVWVDFIADYLEECWIYGKAFRRWYGASRRS